MAKQIINPFVKASTKKKYLKIAIYGGPGVGKTYFGLGFPSPAVIDLEGGTDFYADRFQFSVLDTKSFAEILEAVEFLESGQHDFKTLIIDPITVIWSSLQDGRLEFKTKNVNKAVSGEERTLFTYQDWGQIKRFYSMLMTKLVNLPMHVVMVGRQKDEYEIKGNEMSKIGVKMESEKSTLYLPDICFRLEVDKAGKRIALFEKDRSGHFQVGSKVENISYELFRGLVEQESAASEQAKHQSEEAAMNKDAAFFHERESKPDERPIRDNGNKGINAPTLANIFTWFNALGLPSDYELRYKQYCYKKYSVQSMTELTPEQIQEQRAILTNAMNVESTKQKFYEHLTTYQISEPSTQYETPKQPEQPTQDPPKTNGANGTNGNDEKIKANSNDNSNERIRINGKKVIEDALKKGCGGDEILMDDILRKSLPDSGIIPCLGNLLQFTPPQLRIIYSGIKKEMEK